MVTALAIAGKLDFDPRTDKLINKDGVEVLLDEPQGYELPIKGFDVEDAGYIAPAEDGSNVEVIVAPTSDRLQLLELLLLGMVKTLQVLNYRSKHLVSVQLTTSLWPVHG